MQVPTQALIEFLKQQRNAAMDDAAMLNARIVLLEGEKAELEKKVAAWEAERAAAKEAKVNPAPVMES